MCDYCNGCTKFRCKSVEQAIKCKERDVVRSPMHSVSDQVTKAQWDAFNQVLSWINTQENKMISKGDLYDAVMDMRPRKSYGRTKICRSCNLNPADYQSNYCVGCEAYRDHQS